MKLNNWNINVAKVQAWLDSEDRGDAGTAIGLSIMLGNQTDKDEMRSTYWTAIRNLGGAFEDFPKGRVGQSALPEQAEINATSVRKTVYDAFVGLSNPEVLLKVILPHGRTGGAYSTIEELANSFADAAHRKLVDGYKDKRWKGDMDGNVPLMTPPPTKEQKEETE